MKKLGWGLVAAGAVAVLLVLLGREGATRSQERPQGGEIVRVSRRDLGSVVKATGVVNR